MCKEFERICDKQFKWKMCYKVVTKIQELYYDNDNIFAPMAGEF